MKVIINSLQVNEILSVFNRAHLKFYLLRNIYFQSRDTVFRLQSGHDFFHKIT